MSDKSTNLQLPFILNAQAQKHVTHNEAIINLDILTQLSIDDKDLSTPPPTPQEGSAYIIASSATDEWTGKEGQIAAWQDGAWWFYQPVEGWVAWLKDEDLQYVFDGTSWQSIANSGGGSTTLNPADGDMIGINATADAVNRLSLNSDATLFNHDGSDHQLKINKSLVADNASVLFQTGFSGRAEFGLTGDDDFHMKVSPDGTNFHEGIVIDKNTGEVSFPNTTFSGGGTAVNSVFGRTGSVTAEANDYTYDQIGGVSQNVLMGRLSTGIGGQEALTITQVRSLLNIEDGATADQTGSEIKTALFAEVDTNNFDDAQQSKLATIETGATADQTGSEIKALYEAEADTNVFDDAAVTKLTGIETAADVTGEANVIAALAGSALTNVTVSSADKVIIQDVSDADNIKSVTAQSIADLAAGGSGDVSGPSSSSDSRIVLFDGTSGKSIKELGAGTSGQFLKSQGNGLSPVWDNISGGGDLLSSNNLSDISNAETARSNLGLEIGVDVAAAQSTSSGLSSDLLMMALRLADLEGDTLGLVDGIADPFDDETDVDTAASSGQTYNSGYYSNISAISAISAAAGTVIGNMTGDGGLSAAFDGNNTQSYVDTANTSGGDGYVGKSFPTAQRISSVEIYSTDNFGFAGGASGNLVISLYGKNGSPPANGSDGTLLGETAPFMDSNTLLTKTINSNDMLTAWDHVWVRITDSNLQQVRIAEVVFYDNGSATNMTLQSAAFTAEDSPSSARLIFFIKPIDLITLNTDLIGAVSRDNGTTFTDVSLSEIVSFSDGTTVYEAENVSLISQPIGTSMKWKLTTANSKAIECTGVVLQWS